MWVFGCDIEFYFFFRRKVVKYVVLVIREGVIFIFCDLCVKKGNFNGF